MTMFTSCNPDDADPVNEEEVITTFTYTLTPKSGGSPVLLKFSDPDGDGGAAPVITGGALENGKTYTGRITLINEVANPDVDISAEVKAEGTDHQFFFAVTESLNDAFTLAYTDADASGNPVGLETEFNTVKTATGSLRITLRHKPNKAATGVKNGDITNAGGETDAEVTFSLEIK